MELADCLGALRGERVPGLRPDRWRRAAPSRRCACPERGRHEPQGARRSHRGGQAGGRQGAGLDQGDARTACSSPVAKFMTGHPGPAARDDSAPRPAISCSWWRDAPTVAATVLGRLRVDLARRFKLIPADRDVFAWVIDFPARRVERGREALGRRPPSVHGAARRGPAAARVRSGQGAGQGLRPRAERPGGRRRLDPHPPAVGPGAHLRPDRHLEGGGAGALRLPARRARVRGAAHGRHRLRPRPAGGDPGGPGVHPRGHRVSEDAEGHLPAHRRARSGGRAPAARARDPRRRRSSDPRDMLSAEA